MYRYLSVTYDLCERYSSSVNIMCSFPNNEIMKKEWLAACGIPEGTNWSSSARLCGKHFIEQDFTQRNDGEIPVKRIRLKKGAVPSVFPRCVCILSSSVYSALFCRSALFFAVHRRH